MKPKRRRPRLSTKPFPLSDDYILQALINVNNEIVRLWNENAGIIDRMNDERRSNERRIHEMRLELQQLRDSRARSSRR